jgi:succinoglycan biosynthesis protein ExoA
MTLSLINKAESAAASGARASDAATRVDGADVLVAIPVLNEAAHIETCVRSLMAGDERIGRALVAVVDGGSKDATRAIVTRLMGEFPNLRLLDNPRRLQAAAVNLAARELGAGRRVLVRCDAHALYPPNYVMDVADSLVGHGVASLATPMDAVGKSCFQRANAFIVDTPLGSGGSAHRGGKVSQYVDHGHHAGFDLKVFLHLGGYDESFSHNEDGEYDRRLAKSGGRIFLDALIRIAYSPRATVPALARQYFNYGKGRARNLAKHGDMPKLRQMIPQATLVACVLGLLVAPVLPIALIVPGGYVATLLLASIWAAVKMKSPCGLLAGLASATMHMSWAAGFFRQVVKDANAGR